MTLLLSAADWCYFDKAALPVDVYYTRLKQAGYTAAEMVPIDRRPTARCAGLTLLNAIGPGNLNRADEHDAKVAELDTAIDAAAEAGIAQLIVFSGNRHHGKERLLISDNDGRRAIVAALQRVAPHAERANVTLTLEVFNTFDHPDYQCDRSDFAFDIIRAVGSSHVRVLYDLYHMHRMGESVIDVALTNLPLIAHFHIAAAPKRDFPDAGTSPDYVEIIRRLTAAGYTGHFGMEWLPTRPPLDELADATRRFAPAFTSRQT
ncbi:MAG: sugar phosphate isomerase/epimerase family protein [Tepidisphaeraceae bacterium]